MFPISQLQGLRDDPIPPFTGASGGVNIASVFQMVFALVAVVLLVKWLVPKYIGKFGRKISTMSSGELSIKESAAVAGGHLLLVSARGQTLLIGAGTNGFSTLANLTEETEPSTSTLASGDFDKVLERMKRLQG